MIIIPPKRSSIRVFRLTYSTRGELRNVVMTSEIVYNCAHSQNVQRDCNSAKDSLSDNLWYTGRLLVLRIAPRNKVLCSVAMRLPNLPVVTFHNAKVDNLYLNGEMDEG